MRPYLKKPITKKSAGGVAQGIGPEFKPYCLPPPNNKKPSIERITISLDQAEERVEGIENKVEELLHSDNNKENKCSHDHNIPGLWGMIKTPNRQICSIEERIQI
jgi:hypothetical protein